MPTASERIREARTLRDAALDADEAARKARFDKAEAALTRLLGPPGSKTVIEIPPYDAKTVYRDEDIEALCRCLRCTILRLSKGV